MTVLPIIKAVNLCGNSATKVVNVGGNFAKCNFITMKAVFDGDLSGPPVATSSLSYLDVIKKGIDTLKDFSESLKDIASRIGYINAMGRTKKEESFDSKQSAYELAELHKTITDVFFVYSRGMVDFASPIPIKPSRERKSALISLPLQLRFNALALKLLNEPSNVLDKAKIVFESAQKTIIGRLTPFDSIIIDKPSEMEIGTLCEGLLVTSFGTNLHLALKDEAMVFRKSEGMADEEFKQLKIDLQKVKSNIESISELSSRMSHHGLGIDVIY